MTDPVQTLLGEVEREVSTLPGAFLLPRGRQDRSHGLVAAVGAPPPPGLAAFLAAHDGGRLGADIRIFSVDEAGERRARPQHLTARAWPVGLWPVMERDGRRFALDAEAADSDG